MSGRQPDKILQKADEIKIEGRDHRALPDYIDKYPEKVLILELENELPEKFDWDLMMVYSEKMNGNFYMCVSNKFQMEECRIRGLKFYYRYAVTSFYELDALKEAGVSYALIGVPLIFDLNNVARYEIPLRAIPNLAYEPYLDRPNGICGGWIRPEDVEAYGEYIDVFEFYAPKMLEKESTLYHIYAENKNWPGNLNLLVDFLNFDADNRLIYDEDNFAERRMNCKQRCMSGRTCHYCIDQLKFEQVIRKYRDNKLAQSSEKDNI